MVVGVELENTQEALQSAVCASSSGNYIGNITLVLQI